MRRFAVAILLLVLAFGLISVVRDVQRSSPSGPVPLRKSSTAFPCPAPFSCNYSDPANDVAVLWTSNNSHVTTAAGNWVFSADHPSVDLLRLSSSNSSSSVSVFLKVKTTIATLPNTTYEFRLYPRLDNSTHYIVTYNDGTTTMVTNHTGSSRWNLTTDTQVGNLGWLEVIVNKSDLGGVMSITAWNLDASSKQTSANYTYEDFVWQLPGNPDPLPRQFRGM